MAVRRFSRARRLAVRILLARPRSADVHRRLQHAGGRRWCIAPHRIGTGRGRARDPIRIRLCRRAAVQRNADGRCLVFQAGDGHRRGGHVDPGSFAHIPRSRPDRHPFRAQRDRRGNNPGSHSLDRAGHRHGRAAGRHRRCGRHRAGDCHHRRVPARLALHCAGGSTCNPPEDLREVQRSVSHRIRHAAMSHLRRHCELPRGEYRLRRARGGPRDGAVSLSAPGTRETTHRGHFDMVLRADLLRARWSTA